MGALQRTYEYIKQLTKKSSLITNNVKSHEENVKGASQILVFYYYEPS